MDRIEVASWYSLGYSLEEIKAGKITKQDFQKKKELETKIGKWIESSELNGIITYFDEIYPEELRNIWKPPAVLYFKGNTSFLNRDCLAIVGSRKMTLYGKHVVKKFSKALSKHFVIVSGMAIGIDSEAHKNAEATIAVLGNGVDVCYPKQNRNLYNKILNNGCLISEYLPWERPKKHYFPQRNRIIAGVSKAVLIVEGAKKSGTIITAMYAANFGKDLFAVPGSIFSPNSEGPNYLIKNGAFPVTSPNEILEFYGLRGVEDESS